MYINEERKNYISKIVVDLNNEEHLLNLDRILAIYLVNWLQTNNVVNSRRKNLMYVSTYFKRHLTASTHSISCFTHFKILHI